MAQLAIANRQNSALERKVQRPFIPLATARGSVTIDTNATVSLTCDPLNESGRVI